MQSVPGIPSFPCLRANRRWLLTGIIALSIPAVLAHRGSPRLALWSLVVLLPLGSSLIWRWMRRLNGELQRSRWLVHHLLTDFAEEPADLRPPETVANSVADPIPTPPSQLLDCIMDGAAEAVLVVDPRGKVRLANDAARRLFGLPREGARGRPWDGGCRLMRRDTRTAYPTGQRPLDRALREEVVDLDVFQVNTPGRAGPAWVSCSARPLTAGGPDCGGAIMIARDITSLVHAEEQLLANEQRLHGLIDRLSAIIWTTDTELRITSIRGNGLVQLGKHPDELMNKTFFEVFHVDDPHFHPIAQQLQALRGTPRNYEWHWKGRDYTVSAEAIMGPDESITGTIGIALDVTESRNTSRQMAIAQQIQEKLFPSVDLSPEGYEIAGWTFPAEFAAGDYFDYMPMANGSLGLVVGDVSGHGVGPAMLMAETRAYLRALARIEDRVEEILGKANEFLYCDTDADKYVTLYLGKLEPHRRRFRYASAGHAPAFLLDAEGRVRERMESTTTPLGLFDTLIDPSSRQVDLHDGDILVILTDGVTDASRDGQTFFGEERALEIIRRHRHDPPRTIVESLHRGVHEFLGTRPQEDDVTALVLKVKPS